MKISCSQRIVILVISMQKVINGSTVRYWACINFSRSVQESTARGFCQQLVQMCQISGMVKFQILVIPCQEKLYIRDYLFEQHSTHFSNCNYTFSLLNIIMYTCEVVIYHFFYPFTGIQSGPSYSYIFSKTRPSKEGLEVCTFCCSRQTWWERARVADCHSSRQQWLSVWYDSHSNVHQHLFMSVTRIVKVCKLWKCQEVLVPQYFFIFSFLCFTYLWCFLAVACIYSHYFPLDDPASSPFHACTKETNSSFR